MCRPVFSCLFVHLLGPLSVPLSLCLRLINCLLTSVAIRKTGSGACPSFNHSCSWPILTVVHAVRRMQERAHSPHHSLVGRRHSFILLLSISIVVLLIHAPIHSLIHFIPWIHLAIHLAVFPSSPGFPPLLPAFLSSFLPSLLPFSVLAFVRSFVHWFH